MQKTSLGPVPFFAALIGTLASLLSLVLALLMWHLHGNPAFFAIWMLAAGAMLAYTRFNRRWAVAFERMRTSDKLRAFHAARPKRSMEAEDVVFIDLPCEQT